MLTSKDEGIRYDAQQGVYNLARQCSDTGAVEMLATHLFAVLNGV